MEKTDAYLHSQPQHPATPEPAAEPGCTPLILDEYDFRHQRRGNCLIINNRYFDPSTGQNERDGTDVDAEKMERVFMRLGFDVERIDNVTSMEMSMKMREVAQQDHSDADCFLCVILSHGRQGYVYGTDGLVMIESLTKHFKGDVCESLAGKPKLFFLQACRGTKFDHGVQITMGADKDEVDAATSQIITKTIPAEADFMIAYSVVPGFFSWRNNVDGSWFIQALYRVFMEHGQTMELSHMMLLINKIVAYDFASCTDAEWTDNMKQVPCIESMLTKMIYFRPKY